MARRRSTSGDPAVLALVRRIREAPEELGLAEIEAAWGGVRVRL